MRVIVIHRGYGCETGCCGHAVEVDEIEVRHSFAFDHPYGQDPVEWAKGFVLEKCGPEHVADLDWDNCWVTDNC